MIGTVLSWGSAILNLAQMVKPGDNSLTESKKVLDAALNASQMVSTGSAAKSAQRSTIAPMIGVENTILHQEYMPDLMAVIQLRDITNILLHLSLQGRVDGIKISNLVDSINPNRAGLESFAGLEAMTSSLFAVKGTEANDDNDNSKRQTDVVNIGGKEFTQLTEAAPLAVGKVVMAKTMINGVDVNFPLFFRQVPVPMSPENMELVFAAAKIEDGFKARIAMLKTEEITPSEYLAGTDIIKEKFRIKNGDMTGYYNEAQTRASKNRLAAIRTGVMSVNTMANAFVMSEDTARQIELENGVRFNNPSSRAKIFSRISANTIVVCNERRGVFTFYVDGANIPEVYTRSEIKTKSSKDSSAASLQDLMKLINGGA